MKIKDYSLNVIPAKEGIHVFLFTRRQLMTGFAMTFLGFSCRLFFLLLTLLFISCTETSEIKSTDTDDSTAIAIVRPDQQIRDARISLYDGAYRTTDLYADYIEKYEKFDSTHAWKLDVYFYDSDGNQISNLTADSGVIREQINFMEVFGNVVVTTSDSAVLYTEQLRHNTVNDMIESDLFVRIIQHGDTIQGYGFESDRGLKNIKIKRHVTGTLQGTEEVLE